MRRRMDISRYGFALGLLLALPGCGSVPKQVVTGPDGRPVSLIVVENRDRYVESDLRPPFVKINRGYTEWSPSPGETLRDLAGRLSAAFRFADTVVCFTDGRCHLFATSPENLDAARRYNEAHQAREATVRTTKQRDAIKACSFIGTQEFSNASDEILRFWTADRGGNALYILSESEISNASIGEARRNTKGNYKAQVGGYSTTTVRGEIYRCIQKDAGHPLAGFWKEACDSGTGMALEPAGPGLYAVSNCGPAGSPESVATRPNSSVRDDPEYRVLGENALEILAGGGWKRYIRCP